MNTPNNNEPGGFAVLPKGLVQIWWALPPHWKDLLPAIISFFGESGSGFPSQDLLAAIVKKHRRSVMRTIQQMVKAGLVEKKRRQDSKRQNINTSCVYSLTKLDSQALIDQFLSRLAVTSKVSQPDVTSKVSQLGQSGCDILSVTRDVTSKVSQGYVTSKVSQELTILNEPLNEPKREASPPVPVADAPGDSPSLPSHGISDWEEIENCWEIRNGETPALAPTNIDQINNAPTIAPATMVRVSTAPAKPVAQEPAGQAEATHEPDAEGTESKPAPKGRKAKGQPKAPPKPKARSLTDENISALKSDRTVWAMKAYWCYGPQAIGLTADQCASLGPSQTHWAPATRNYDAPEPEASAGALAAFLWCRLMMGRAKAGEPIELPTAFPKVIGIVNTLLKTNARAEFVGLVNTLADNWPKIREKVFGWIVNKGETVPLLSEAHLLNTKVVTECKVIGGSYAPATVVESKESREYRDRQGVHLLSASEMEKFAITPPWMRDDQASTPAA
jgi:hypothetical protein